MPSPERAALHTVRCLRWRVTGKGLEHRMVKENISAYLSRITSLNLYVTLEEEVSYPLPNLSSTVVFVSLRTERLPTNRWPYVRLFRYSVLVRLPLLPLLPRELFFFLLGTI